MGPAFQLRQVKKKKKPALSSRKGVRHLTCQRHRHGRYRKRKSTAMQRLVACCNVLRQGFAVVDSQADGTSAGSVLFDKKLPGLQVSGHFSCEAGRCAVLGFALNNTECRVRVRTQHGRRKGFVFFHGLEQRLCAENLVMLAHFNCVLSARDKTSTRGYRDKNTDLLTSVVAKRDVEDVAECIQGTSVVKYTRFEGKT